MSRLRNIPGSGEVIDANARERTLSDMITVALEAAIQF